MKCTIRYHDQEFSRAQLGRLPVSKRNRSTPQTHTPTLAHNVRTPSLLVLPVLSTTALMKRSAPALCPGALPLPTRGREALPGEAPPPWRSLTGRGRCSDTRVLRPRRISHALLWLPQKHPFNKVPSALHVILPLAPPSFPRPQGSQALLMPSFPHLLLMPFGTSRKGQPCFGTNLPCHLGDSKWHSDGLRPLRLKRRATCPQR